jgi:hypothetical protein
MIDRKALWISLLLVVAMVVASLWRLSLLPDWRHVPLDGAANSAAAFVKRCDAFTAKYGDRFKPNKLLRDMAAKNETFYGKFAPVKQAA